MKLIVEILTKLNKIIPFSSKYIDNTIKSTLPKASLMNKKFLKNVRYDGRSKKRQWEDRRTDKGEGLDFRVSKIAKVEDEMKTDAEHIVDRVKRRKYVLLMGYSGDGYFGMQRNPNAKTIEEELFKALFELDYITPRDFEQVQNMQFQRAARTDKGVSAVRQTVSLKLREDFAISKINEKLPESIKIFAFKRVTKGFNSKSQCDARTYIYVTPTIAFDNSKTSESQENYRISPENLKQVKDILSRYVGTKNFHNFTSKKKPNDPSAKRFIKLFECGEPFIRDGIEFFVLKVNGQSFMMHQIRKMVGLAIAIARGTASDSTFEKAFTQEKIEVPKAPGLGLILDNVHYDRYNYRYGSDGLHETLMWEHVDKEIEEFKDKYVYPTIIKAEKENQSMINWINKKLCYHSYDNPEGKDDNSDEECGADDDCDEENQVNKPQAENEPEEKLKQENAL